MKTRTRRYRQTIGLFYVLLLGIMGCHHEPPEQRLRQTIAQMQAAIEQGEPRKFMAHVTDDFIGNDSLDQAGLNQLLRGQLLLNAKVGIQTGPLSVEIQQGSATVRFTVLLTGSSGSFLPERGQMQQVTSGWREIDGQWQLYSAQWHPAGG